MRHTPVGLSRVSVSPLLLPWTFWGVKGTCFAESVKKANQEGCALRGKCFLEIYWETVPSRCLPYRKLLYGSQDLFRSDIRVHSICVSRGEGCHWCLSDIVLGGHHIQLFRRVQCGVEDLKHGRNVHVPLEDLSVEGLYASNVTCIRLGPQQVC